MTINWPFCHSGLLISSRGGVYKCLDRFGEYGFLLMVFPIDLNMNVDNNGL